MIPCYFNLLSMGLSSEDQFQKIVSSAEHILVVLPENPTGDMIGAGFGLALFVENLGIEVTVAFRNNSKTKELFHFLPEPKNIIHSLTGTRDFTLSFKTEHNPISNIRSERSDDAVYIHVTPENGTIDSRDFSFGLAAFPYSSFISIGARDKEDFGALLTEIPDIFYDVPIINLDNKSENEHFGQLNIVTLTASSLSEIIGHLCLHMAPDLLTREVAQCLLAGIISATDSFRAKHTTPKSLSLASTLIENGADQQEIVGHLYKSQPLALLQLWGRTLSNLTTHDHGRIISTCIDQDDFTETDTESHYLPQIIEKVKQNHTTAKFFIIIYEDISEGHRRCVALIDASRYGDLPEEVFGKKAENGLYETTFSDSDCGNGREKIATLIQENTK